MLLKLIKHELKGYFRKLKYIYLVAFIIFLINTLAINGNYSNPNQLEAFAIFFIFSMLYVVFLMFFVFYTIVKRYAQTMFGSGGYLTNTLPINPLELIVSKAISIIIVNLLNSLFIAALFSMMFITRKEFTSEIHQAFVQINFIFKFNIVHVIKFILYILVSSLASNLLLITAVTIAHLKGFVKHKYIFGILSFFLLSYIYNEIHEKIIDAYVNFFGLNFILGYSVANVNPLTSAKKIVDIFLGTLYYPSITYLLVISIVLALFNSYLIKNHLNLE